MSVTVHSLQSEADLQRAVVDLAQLTGWLVMHTRAARTSDGWRTPIQGDRGFPDLVLCDGERTLFVELKSQSGRLSDEQRCWRSRLLAAGADWRLWRPEHWDGIVETLRGDA